MTADAKVAEYRARAQSARRLADLATLDNQKEAHIRSAQAWEIKAEKIELIERLRMKNDAAIEERRLIYKRRRDKSS